MSGEQGAIDHTSSKYKFFFSNSFTTYLRTCSVEILSPASFFGLRKSTLTPKFSTNFLIFSESVETCILLNSLLFFATFKGKYIMGFFLK